MGRNPWIEDTVLYAGKSYTAHCVTCDAQPCEDCGSIGTHGGRR